MNQFDLTHYDEFKEVLSDYKVSSHASSVLLGLPLVLLVAATSTGKNTLMRRLLQSGDYYYLVSDTTRPPRINDGVMEQNGVEYWFRSEEEMLNELRNGNFLEAELVHDQQVSGISIRELEKAKEADKVAITDVDPAGVNNIVSAKPDTLVILLVPPSLEEWKRRMAMRGQMSEVETRRRLQTALRLFTEGLTKDYYQFVISEDVVHSADVVNALVQGQPNPHQESGRELLEQLKSQLEQELK